ncbi:nucleolar complex protein 14 [Saguinus oedipus]|uniref:Nucleolar complex protein 14 n=1 Tax=Saguinus oedipus TaxID=9490 RepID=A0ABQ9W3D8_SAGOE|nr:nucleolar complex protein 14 [Saguinus oedipus]
MGKAKKVKARRKLSGAPAGARGGPAKASSNPFEVKVNRQKFQILGRKTRHDVGLPGVSRARALRKDLGPTLLSGRLTFSVRRFYRLEWRRP